MPEKFCRFEGGESVPHDYGDVYFEQPCGTSSRLVIGASEGGVELLSELSTQLGGNPFGILYVLLVPRLGNREAGRYQSPPIESHAELTTFLSAFRDFFEGDGRHHVWVGSGANDGLLVYDNHNVIFAYGPIAQYAAILQSRGFRQSEFWFPAPHTHSYNEEHDAEEERLMSEWEWTHFPLQDEDNWN